MAVHNPEPWHTPFKRLATAATELVCHTAILALILIAVRFIEWILDHLWGTGEKLLFDVVPMRFVFDGADVALILAFLIFGGYAVYKAYFRA